MFHHILSYGLATIIYLVIGILLISWTRVGDVLVMVVYGREILEETLMIITTIVLWPLAFCYLIIHYAQCLFYYLFNKK